MAAWLLVNLGKAWLAGGPSVAGRGRRNAADGYLPTVLYLCAVGRSLGQLLLLLSGTDKTFPGQANLFYTFSQLVPLVFL